jgi:hypothetical protein
MGEGGRAALTTKLLGARNEQITKKARRPLRTARLSQGARPVLYRIDFDGLSF